MQDDFCELRIDISLTGDGGPRQFERGWRETLAAQRLTALATPPAEAVSARFRLCGTPNLGEQMAVLMRYLPTRLAALPGSPTVATESPSDSPDWRGVRIWLSYRSQNLTGLLQRSKTKHTRGRRR